VTASPFSTEMGYHRLAVIPLLRVVRASTHELPVHLSSRMEPRLPPLAFVMVTVKQSLCEDPALGC
jgi:hypothetical protein